MKYLGLIVTFFIAIGSAVGQNETGAELAHEIEWLSFEEAYELNKTEPKRWVIDISTSWCGWCKKMDTDTFSDSLIVSVVNENYYAVALDGEYKKDIVLGEQKFSFVESGRRGYHELPAQLMGGKMSYPTIIFLETDLSILSPIPGYKGPEDFIALLDYFKLYNAVDNPIKWEEFNASYESPYDSGK